MGWPSRRDVLAAFLGGSVAACAKKPTRPPVPGGFVDEPLSAAGHLLREGPPPRAAAPERTLDALVVGAGVAGLSAAWRLAGAGLGDFAVLELDQVPGGTAKSGKNAVTAFPWGAHYLPAPLEATGPVPRLLKELGVLKGVDDKGAPRFAEEALIHEPEERLWMYGEWYEGLYPRAGASPEDLAQLRRFETQMADFARARDGKGRKAFAVPLEAGSDDSEWTALDRLSMGQWLEQQGFTSPRLRWLVDYACRDDYGAPAAEISAWAGIWYFAARQTGDHRSEGYLSWPEGNGRLVRALADAAGPARLQTGVVVHTLAPAEGGGWDAHGVDVRTKAPRWLRARQVVLACPRFAAAKVLEPWRKAPPAFLGAFHYGPWVVANLALSQLPTSRGFPQAWDNVLYGSQSLGYVVATHQSERGHHTGPTVFTWYYPVGDADPKAAREKLFAAKYEDWEAVVLADLRRGHPDLYQVAERLEVMRWGHAMIRPVPGFLFGGARAQAQASLEGSLHFAHSDLGGLALFEEASHHGVRAAEQALAGLGRKGESWL